MRANAKEDFVYRMHLDHQKHRTAAFGLVHMVCLNTLTAVMNKLTKNEWLNLHIHLCFVATYGPPSPCVQRGRFAVIPEEPLTASADITSNNIAKRSPSPDWDFNTEVSSYKQTTRTISNVCRENKSKFRWIRKPNDHREYSKKPHTEPLALNILHIFSRKPLLLSTR